MLCSKNYAYVNYRNTLSQWAATVANLSQAQNWVKFKKTTTLWFVIFRQNIDIPIFLYCFKDLNKNNGLWNVPTAQYCSDDSCFKIANLEE